MFCMYLENIVYSVIFRYRTIYMSTRTRSYFYCSKLEHYWLFLSTWPFKNRKKYLEISHYFDWLNLFLLVIQTFCFIFASNTMFPYCLYCLEIFVQNSDGMFPENVTVFPVLLGTHLLIIAVPFWRIEFFIFR